MINSLLDGHALGLGDAEEGEGEREGETSGPNEADAGTDLLLDLGCGKAGGQIWGIEHWLEPDLRNDQVEKPVGTGTEGDTEVGQSDGESLSTHDPGDGSPR